uniref:NADH dehydrogenase subunit 6 n=1 Tax=Glyptonotus cf. antarcticus FK-2009 TaxID=692432 RepID=E3SX95_9CRUS|nr:NADH dehydrogenase subunit 6 [Glyptonotus cf. antarcticus FK-2009]
MLMLNLGLISMALSGLMVQLMTPYLMVGVLILQTLLVCVYLGLVKSTLWFSYILFLVVLGGMLVILIYTSSLVSEEILESVPFAYMGITLFILSGANYLFWLIGGNTMGVDLLLSENKIENLEAVSSIFSLENLFIYSLVVGYLLLALICAMNLVKSKYGPLRMLN